MPTITIVTKIHAPIERCFDLSRSIDLHTLSTSATKEKAITGVTSGLIAMGQEVTWRAKHFGIWQILTSKITAFDYPIYFRDSMIEGAFKRFDHHHYFDYKDGYTVVTDIFDYDSPYGYLGRVINMLILTRYMRMFLEGRNRCIKDVAESDKWMVFLQTEKA